MNLLDVGCINAWEDISDLTIPHLYLKWTIGIINGLHSNSVYSNDAFNASIDLLLNLFPYVARNLSDREIKRMEDLFSLPKALGGLG
ncbi:hypothetical protein [Magnetofaba australis]|uniref:hypothetical protein n=1 Tax=Magnetofaba australis TaxID=1472297 RepID=UPI00117DB2CC|nr:hypothetical protein [Magnetofaba australis]